jgi:hypothetical protein
MLIERLDQHRGHGQQQITVKHVTVNGDQALVADSINTGGPSKNGGPARSPGNQLTTGRQKPMDTLSGDLIGWGVRTKYDYRPHAKCARRCPV